MLLDCRDDPALHVSSNLRIALVVDTRDLLIALGDDSHLCRGGAFGIGGDTRGFDSGIAAALHQCLRVVVLARDRDECRVAAERGDVVGDVGGAADAVRLMIERDDGHRRFRRDARHAADDERVEHRVADDEHMRAVEGGNEAGCPLSRERKQFHYRRAPPRTAA